MIDTTTPWRRPFAPVDAASLVAVRIAFGVALVLRIALLYAHDDVSERYVGVEHHFTFFSWLPVLPDAALIALLAAIAVLGIFIAIGFFSRVCCVLAGFAYAYLFLLEKCLYQNHDYLIFMLGFLLAAMPVHDELSTSALLLHRRPSTWTAPAWCLWAVRAQIAVVYVYGGIAKLNADWLFHAEPIRQWLVQRADWPVVGDLLALPSTAFVISWAGCAFDLVIAPALAWRKTRAVAVVALLAFHVLNAMLWSIDVFPFLAVPATLTLLPPGWPRRLVRALPAPAFASASMPSSTPSPIERALAVAVAVHVAVQIVVPLRPLLAGDFLWDEDGHRFAWHMMLHQKVGEARLYAVEPATHTTFEIDATQHVRDFQAPVIARRPDVMRDLCVWLAPLLERERDHGPIEIHVVDEQSLNGHEPALLLDPAVDLAHVPADERLFVVPREDAAAQEKARKAAVALRAAANPTP